MKNENAGKYRSWRLRDSSASFELRDSPNRVSTMCMTQTFADMGFKSKLIAPKLTLSGTVNMIIRGMFQTQVLRFIRIHRRTENIVISFITELW